MKRDVLPPLALLAAILAFCLWNASAMSERALRWQEPLQEAEACVRAQDWPAARRALAESYRDWSRQQTYLHVAANHGSVGEAEAMYRRCQSFADGEEAGELLAELAGLQEQLQRLADMERFSLRNIL